VAAAASSFFSIERPDVIKRVGSAVVLLPKTKSWGALVQSLEKFPEDFMADREQPQDTERRDSLS